MKASLPARAARFLFNAALSILCAAAMAAAVGGVQQSWQALSSISADAAAALAAPAVACTEDVACMTAKAVQMHAEGRAALDASRMYVGR